MGVAADLLGSDLGGDGEGHLAVVGDVDEIAHLNVLALKEGLFEGVDLDHLAVEGLDHQEALADLRDDAGLVIGDLEGGQGQDLGGVHQDGLQGGSHQAVGDDDDLHAGLGLDEEERVLLDGDVVGELLTLHGQGEAALDHLGHHADDLLAADVQGAHLGRDGHGHRALVIHGDEHAVLDARQQGSVRVDLVDLLAEGQQEAVLPQLAHNAHQHVVADVLRGDLRGDGAGHHAVISDGHKIADGNLLALQDGVGGQQGLDVQAVASQQQDGFIQHLHHEAGGQHGAEIIFGVGGGDRLLGEGGQGGHGQHQGHEQQEKLLHGYRTSLGGAWAFVPHAIQDE